MKAKKNKRNCEQNIYIVSSQIKCENIIYLGYIISFKCSWNAIATSHDTSFEMCWKWHYGGNAHDINFWSWLVNK